MIKFAETNICIYGKLYQIRLGDETPAQGQGELQGA